MATTDHIALCPCCSNPLLSTLIISKAEWFCLKCRWSGGIFDGTFGNPGIVVPVVIRSPAEIQDVAVSRSDAHKGA